MAYRSQFDFGPEAFATPIEVRRVAPADCLKALKEGFDDFDSMPTYPAFDDLFDTLSGLANLRSSPSLRLRNSLHLVFPLAAGFALVGPFVAIGRYEMSRRRCCAGARR